MSQVIVGTLIMETGCHIDGSHQTTLDFDLRVIHFAVDKGAFELSVEDAQLVFDCEHGSLDIGDLPTLMEVSNDAVEALNERTEDGYVWSIEDQSLFLTAEEGTRNTDLVGTPEEVREAITKLDLDRAKRALDLHDKKYGHN